MHPIHFLPRLQCDAEIGPLQRLPRPVPSRALRRIAFIATTLQRLVVAPEMNDLWQRDDPQQRLWLALHEAGLLVEYCYQVGHPDGDVVVDFALFCRDGRIAVLCDDADNEGAVRERRPELEAELPRCASAVIATVRQLGGQIVPRALEPGSEHRA